MTYKNWSDRDIAERASREYFEELALGDHLLAEWEKRQQAERKQEYFDQAFKDLWEAIKDEVGIKF